MSRIALMPIELAALEGTFGDEVEERHRFGVLLSAYIKKLVIEKQFAVKFFAEEVGATEQKLRGWREGNNFPDEKQLAKIVELLNRLGDVFKEDSFKATLSDSREAAHRIHPRVVDNPDRKRVNFQLFGFEEMEPPLSWPRNGVFITQRGLDINEITLKELLSFLRTEDFLVPKETKLLMLAISPTLDRETLKEALGLAARVKVGVIVAKVGPDVTLTEGEIQQTGILENPPYKCVLLGANEALTALMSSAQASVDGWPENSLRALSAIVLKWVSHVRRKEILTDLSPGKRS